MQTVLKQENNYVLLEERKYYVFCGITKYDLFKNCIDSLQYYLPSLLCADITLGSPNRFVMDS